MNDTTNTSTTHLFSRINILADLCTNHCGDLTTYLQMCEAIIDMKCIPKIQLFSPDTFNREWPLPTPWIPSVFRPSDVEWALSQSTPPLALKIASVESTYTHLVEVCSRTELPLYISTGGMTNDEIGTLLTLLEDLDHAHGLCLMHCTALYPTPDEHLNILRIDHLLDVIDDFMLPNSCVGWSCHTPHAYSPTVAALALGAEQFEFHIKSNACTRGTLDEECAVTLDLLREMLWMWRSCDISRLGTHGFEDDYTPPDRKEVLRLRKRWEFNT